MEIEQRVPKDMRKDFASSPKRIGELLAQLLLRKSLAQQAKAARLDEQESNAIRLRLDVERALAQFRVAAIEEKATAEFDAKLGQYVSRAREIYLADRERYRTPDEVSASHILIDVRKRGSDDARKLAEQARTKIVGGADFKAVANEMSDDPSVSENGGNLGWFTKETMVAPFSEAVFAMKTVGSLSEPVRTTFGWHIIRLDGRRNGVVKPFDEVRDEIVGELRKKYVDDQREAVLNVVRDDPKTTYDEVALDAFVSGARGKPLPKLPAAGAPAAKP